MDVYPYGPYYTSTTAQLFLRYGNWAGGGYSANSLSPAFIPLTANQKLTLGVDSFDSVSAQHDKAYDAAQQTLLTNLANGMAGHEALVQYLEAIEAADRTFAADASGAQTLTSWGQTMEQIGVKVMSVKADWEAADVARIEDASSTYAAQLDHLAKVPGQIQLAQTDINNFVTGPGIKANSTDVSTFETNLYHDDPFLAETEDSSVLGSAILEDPALGPEILSLGAVVGLYIVGGTIVDNVEQVVDAIGATIDDAIAEISDGIQAVASIFGSSQVEPISITITTPQGDVIRTVDSNGVATDTFTFNNSASYSVSFDANTYANEFYSTTDNVLVVSLLAGRNVIATLDLNSTGGGTLHLTDNTVFNLPVITGVHLTGAGTTATPLETLANYLVELGDPLTAAQLDQLNFNTLYPSGTPHTVTGTVQKVDDNHANIIFSPTTVPGAIITGQDTAFITNIVNGKPTQVSIQAANIVNLGGFGTYDLAQDTITDIQTLKTNGNSVSLTQSQFDGFTTITGGGRLTTASEGTFDLSAANVDPNSIFQLTATDWLGTTLIGNNQNNQLLTASLFGSDTLQAGSGTGDKLIAGEGTDTLIGGSGGDIFVATNGLAAGSVVTGGSGSNTLQADGDITGASISGVQTLSGGPTLTVSQFDEFSTILGFSAILAATSGTYSLVGKTNNSSAVGMTAEASGGTTLIGDNADYESLTASATGNDTLIAGNGYQDTLYAGGGVDTLVGGGGSLDVIYANNGLAAGSVVEGNDAAMVASGDISGATITGVNTLDSNDITVSAQEMGGIGHFFSPGGTIGNLFAATGGTYSLTGALGDSAYNMTALSSVGTTLEEDYSTGAHLTAGLSGNDTLKSTNATNMTLDASYSAGNDTLTVTNGSGNVLNAEFSTGNDTLNASGGGSDTLDALGSTGAVAMYGGSGNDIFNSGFGNDYMQGNGGSDAYNIYSANGTATYTINNFHTDNGQSTINFKNIASSSVVATRSGNNLLLTDASDPVVVQNYFLGADYQFASVSFADGVVLTPQQLNIVSPTLTTLATFTGANGAIPFAGLVADPAGNLYGTTSSGGASSAGTVFEIAKTGTGYSGSPITLVSFNNTNGRSPESALIADAAGNLFGTTVSGGANGAGTVFEIAKTGTGYNSTLITLASFNGTNGRAPQSALIADSAGNLFGTTSSGGANSDGVIFEIAKTGTGYSGTPTVLASFNGTNGANPAAGLVSDAAGNLFGTTQNGGAQNDGTVFEIAKTSAGYSSTPATLVNFNGTSGKNPLAGLIIDAAGNLLGTTELGGAFGVGTVFEVVNNGTGFGSSPITLTSFNINGLNDGFAPVGVLIADAKDNLFGTTGGGVGGGTVFEIAKTATGYSNTHTTLAAFGTNPFGGSTGAYTLIADVAGNLFGTTQELGASGDGSVFELSNSGFAPFPPNPTFTGFTPNPVEQSQTTVIGTVTPGVVGDIVTLTETAGAGTLSLGAVLANGTQQVIYAAPASVPTSTIDTVGFTITENGASVKGTASVQLDAGPSIAAQVPSVVEKGQTTVIGTVTPGLAGDTLTQTETAGAGTLALGAVQANGTQQVIYTAPASVNKSAVDAVTYTVADQHKDVVASGTAKVQLDAGPTAGSGATTIGHGKTANLTALVNGLITPGIAGDTETLTGVSAAHGTAVLGTTNAVTYTAPASGPDTLTFTVQDQYGGKATGTVAVIVDPGPTVSLAAIGAASSGQTVVVGAVTPGLTGDSLALVNTSGTGLSLSGNQVLYTVGSTPLANISFQIQDQYGDQSPQVTVIIGTNGSQTVSGPSGGYGDISLSNGNPTVNLSGSHNVVTAGNGNIKVSGGQNANVIAAGNGNSTVSLSGSGNSVTLGNGNQSITAGGGGTVAVGNGNSTISLGGGSNTITAGNGNDSITVAGSGSAVKLGNGNNTISLGGGGNTITAGNGNDSITVAGSGSTVKLGNGVDTVHGGTGDTINIAGNTTLTLYGTNEMVFIGTGNSTINDFSTGLGLKIGPTAGNDVLAHFASDPGGVVDLIGGIGGFTTTATVLSALNSDGHGGTLLSFGHGSSLDFAGVASAQLTAKQFAIG